MEPRVDPRIGMTCGCRWSPRSARMTSRSGWHSTAIGRVMAVKPETSSGNAQSAPLGIAIDCRPEPAARDDAPPCSAPWGSCHWHNLHRLVACTCRATCGTRCGTCCATVCAMSGHCVTLRPTVLAPCGETVRPPLALFSPPGMELSSVPGVWLSNSPEPESEPSLELRVVGGTKRLTGRSELSTALMSRPATSNTVTGRRAALDVLPFCTPGRGSRNWSSPVSRIGWAWRPPASPDAVSPGQSPPTSGPTWDRWAEMPVPCPHRSVRSRTRHPRRPLRRGPSSRLWPHPVSRSTEDRVRPCLPRLRHVASVRGSSHVIQRITRPQRSR